MKHCIDVLWHERNIFHDMTRKHIASAYKQKVNTALIYSSGPGHIEIITYVDFTEL